LETNIGTGFKTIDVYPIYLTKQELVDLEDVLYEKATVMSIISDRAKETKRSVEASRASYKSIYYERLAGKVGAPLDEIYKAQYADSKNKANPTKENN
jgi:hypothetical protein